MFRLVTNPLPTIIVNLRLPGRQRKYAASMSDDEEPPEMLNSISDPGEKNERDTEALRRLAGTGTDSSDR